jgi:hypothetical protein
MKKIPTIFERDWGGDRSRVLDRPHSECGWVFAGEGVATRKINGTCCLVRDGHLFERREFKKNDPGPGTLEVVEFDDETGKSVGWVPVTDDPSDRWHREAFSPDLADGTYELVGPKVQGNPEGYERHSLVPHDALIMVDQPPREFAGLASWFVGKDIEGVVFHHPDGRMGKIKKRDFGLRRKE